MELLKTPASNAGILSILAKMRISDLYLHYGDVLALDGISVSITSNAITAFIGPSGCGKSSFLRCLNRMNDLIATARIEGKVLLNEANIYDRSIDVASLRRKVGMVFQKANPFPTSIYENVAAGPKAHKVNKYLIPEIVEASLRNAALWDEVKDKLKNSALDLSGGQQQRLCIARSLAITPDVLLLDEPCSALDPVSTGQIEELMIQLREKVTIVLVTHNLFQASRIANFTGFFLSGKLLEFGDTTQVFTTPRHPSTEGFIRGRFG